MNFGFYASGSATRIKKYLAKDPADNVSFVLIDNIENEELRIKCKALNIPLYEYSYKKEGLKGKQQNDFISSKLLELLKSSHSDYCFIFGDRILNGNLLDVYNNKLINFHPSVLPSFKGQKAIDLALNNGAILLGNTAHFINEELDAGAIVMQSLLPAKLFENYDDVLDLQIPMLRQIMEWLEQKRLTIDNNKVTIIDAQYQLGTFIPNLEIDEQQ